jgi:CDP-diacylglycerol--serine O-phosphatidyltransferase
MIGFYNYSVILTYVGLASSIVGITEIFQQHYKWALLCLIISGICDMFDGKIARAMKNRSDEEKVFGIQIDSLCDLICFGMLPGLFGYYTCSNRYLGTLAAVLFVLAAVIRLGYFNVKEMARQQQTTEHRKYYQGLPVTTISMILPTVYIVRQLIGTQHIPGSYYSIVLLIVSFLFVFDFKVKKPGNTGCVIMSIYGVAILAGVLLVK